MNFQVTYFLECLSASFSKIPVSIGIAAVTLLIGLLVGTPIALIRVFHVKILDPVFTALIAVVKAIPVNLIILIAGLWFNDNFNGIAQALGLSVTVADVDKDLCGNLGIVDRSDRTAVGIGSRCPPVSGSWAV